jgi:glycosidase
MIESINSIELKDMLNKASSARVQKVKVDRKNVLVPVPFPSPEDWRDHWIYFLMIDRFNNPNKDPNYEWNDPNCDKFQGGTFNGITEQLDYIKSLGAGAIWITPPFKNCIFEETYYGYGIQDFLAIEPRFASDGTPETAELELQDLILQAHARGLYVIFDIVLNHAGNVFFYRKDGQLYSDLQWRDAPYEVMWRDEHGNGKWTLPPEECTSNACVWPKELRCNKCFRQRGQGGESGGDFGSLKELLTEFYEYKDGYYYHVVRDTLIKAFSYIIARYDVDGFRIDTLKYIERDFARTFGNAMREFALGIGKKNFFTFGEVWDNEEKITRYIGRYSSDEDGIIGVDAALDFPLFGKLSGTIKGLIEPTEVTRVFEERKQYQKSHIGYHGEASKFFVTFLDNHDQHERFYYQDEQDITKYDLQVSLGVGALFTMQGIPSLYYGTEQGLNGRGNKLEAVREALWGKGKDKPDKFNKDHAFYQAIQKISLIRETEPALRYGRQYFREISQNNYDFNMSADKGGVMAYSRILNDREILIAINTNANNNWAGDVIVDFALNSASPSWQMLYSNVEFEADRKSKIISKAAVHKINGEWLFGPVRALPLTLDVMEIQILRKGS